MPKLISNAEVIFVTHVQKLFELKSLQKIGNRKAEAEIV